MARPSLTGHRIRSLRKERGITQANLAQTADISAAYLNLIEHNRRPIGGATLLRLAAALNVAPADLTGSEEDRLLADLEEVAADPLFMNMPITGKDLVTVLGVSPAIASMMVQLYRAYRMSLDQLDRASERMSHDPFLSNSAHNILSRITSIRSFSEILQDYEDLNDTQRARFVDGVARESELLTDTAQEMFNFLNSREAGRIQSAPSDEVDDLIYDHGNFFPTLEDIAEQLRKNIETRDGIFLTDLIRHLEFGHRVEVSRDVTLQNRENHRLVFWDEEERVLHLSRGMAPESSRFEAARMVSRLEASEPVESLIAKAHLTSAEAQTRAREALHGYVASALIFPYDRFLEDAQILRHDIELLQQNYAGSWEQVCQRLTSLRKPGSEGIPFHFLRTDLAGNISKRFSASGLQLPRYGGVCPRWSIHTSQLTPDKITTQLAETADGASYLFIARTVVKYGGGFHDPRQVYSVLLGCDAAYAGRLVYADGLSLENQDAITPVGITCQRCTRSKCRQRAQSYVEMESV